MSDPRTSAELSKVRSQLACLRAGLDIGAYKKAATKAFVLGQVAVLEDIAERLTLLDAAPAVIDKQKLSITDAAPAQGWQPIETAPQMRKVMVSYVNALGKRRTGLACYYKAHSLEMHDDYAEVGVYDEATGDSFAPEGWYEEHESDSPLMPINEELTHWVPLPAPPSSPTTEEK